MSSLREVADRAGVSIKTVSNVVNAVPTVTPSIRDRVKQAISELNYRPNLAARNLRRGKTGVIGFAVPRIDNAYFSELANHVVAEADLRGIEVLIHQTNGVAERERLLLNGGFNSLMDGLILSPAMLEREELDSIRTPMPMVLLGEHLKIESIPYVGIDNHAAGEAAVNELLAVGRNRILTLGVYESTPPDAAHQRWNGACAAIREGGSPGDRLVPVPFERLDQAGGYEAMTGTIKSGIPFDAVFCYNDAVALGAIRALHDAGFRVPRDAAVIGIDDINDGRFTTPTLSTIAPDKVTIARLAIESLHRSINEDPPLHQVHHLVDFKTKARESSRGRAK